MKSNFKNLLAEYESLKDHNGTPLFSIKTIETLGFPAKPTCMAYSRHLGLLAIATENGKLLVVGVPGYSLRGNFRDIDKKIIYIHFLCFKKILLTLSACLYGYYVDFWQIIDSESPLKCIDNDSIKLPDIKGLVSAVCFSNEQEILTIGTKQGYVYVFKLQSKKFSCFTLAEDYVLNNCEMKKYCQRLGSVQSIQINNTENEKLLIGYYHGLILIWNINGMKVDSCVFKREPLMSVCWGTNESMFVSSHAKGIICCWSPATILNQDIHSRYQPIAFFPREKINCQAINKIIWRDMYFIFNGGLPEDIPLDRNVISIMTGGIITQIIEFGSKIIQYIDISPSILSHNNIPKNTFYLFVLTADELVSLLIKPDISQKNIIKKSYQVKQIIPFHFLPINSSNINSSLIITIPDDKFCDSLYECGKKSIFDKFEDKWPLDGGVKYNIGIHKIIPTCLITGHEDGNIYFWNISEKKRPSLIYIIQTSSFYNINDFLDIKKDERFCAICDIYPIKVGFYEPYCDDQRYSIQKICFCQDTQTIIIGGAAGNVLLFKFKSGYVPKSKISYLEYNLMHKYPSFIWKGHDKLDILNNIDHKSGYILDTMLNIFPHSPIFSLEYCMKWGLLGIGSMYGFILYDSNNSNFIYSAATYDISAIPSAGENINRNSFFRSMRNSLRIFSSKKKRNKHNTEIKNQDKVDFDSGESFNRKRPGTRIFSNTFRQSFKNNEFEHQKNRRESQRFEAFIKDSSTRYIGGKKIDQNLKGLIKSMAFVECPMQNTPKIKYMFVVGTNYGRLYIIYLRFQINEKNMFVKSIESTKEIQMNHKSPIINLRLIGLEAFSHNLSPLTGNSDKITPFDHYLLTCTEEQIKIINLFTLKTKYKLNITSTQGLRLKKLFPIKRFPQCRGKLSNYLTGITSDGRILVISLHNLKCLNSFTYFSKDDVLQINTSYIDSDGNLIYQVSTSEIDLVSIKNMSVSTPAFPSNPKMAPRISSISVVKSKNHKI